MKPSCTSFRLRQQLRQQMKIVSTDRKHVALHIGAGLFVLFLLISLHNYVNLGFIQLLYSFEAVCFGKIANKVSVLQFSTTTSIYFLQFFPACHSVMTVANFLYDRCTHVCPYVRQICTYSAITNVNKRIKKLIIKVLKTQIKRNFLRVSNNTE